MTIAWDGRVRGSGVSFSLDNPSRSGGMTLGGTDQVVTSPAARWRARVTPAGLTRSGELFAWDGMLANLGGRAGTLLVPCFDACHSPATAAGFRNSMGVIADVFDDETEFSDGTTFDEEATEAALTADAAAGAIQVAILSNYAPAVGMKFGLGPRRYVVKYMVDHGGGNYTLTFTPRLRDARVSGERVLWAASVCLMRLASDDSGAADLELLRFARPTVELVEAFP